MNFKTLLAILWLSLSVAAQSRMMTVTIDDLPYVALSHPQYWPYAQRATKEILRALQAHRTPAVGFVNENKLQATGEVDEMLEQIAEIHAEDVTYEVSKLSETIEPILLAIMGIMVGVLLLGVFTPLWNLGQATLHPTKP